RLRRTAEIGVVEVHESIRSRPCLAGLTQLVPLLTRRGCAHGTESVPNDLAVPNDDLMLPANFAALRLNPDAVRGAHKCHGDLVCGARDVEPYRTARRRQHAPSEESTTQNRGKFRGGTGGQSVWQPPDLATSLVKQTQLAGKGLAIDHSHEELRRSRSRAGRRQLLRFGAYAVQLGEVLAHALHDLGSVQLRFERDTPGDRVQSTRETEDRRDLSDPLPRLRDGYAHQFAFHLSG